MHRSSIFKNKDILDVSYPVSKIIGRDEQIEKLAQVLAPILRNEIPSNIFVYGPPGTGKTLTVRKVVRDLEEVAVENNVPLRYLYINAGLRKQADTEYRLYSYIANELGFPTPTSGIPKSAALDHRIIALESIGGYHILIIDEMDVLIRKSKNALYTLTRLNSELENSKIIIIGIVNDLSSISALDSRIKSALSVEEVYFPPYDAYALKEILEYRAREAFNDNVINEEIIQLIAAYSAKHHGDARRAIELLRIVGELAERKGLESISKDLVIYAVKELTKSKFESAIKSLPYHAKLVLRAIVSLKESNMEVFSGSIYNVYARICMEEEIKPLTSRRVSDLILQLEDLGLVYSTVISKGRYGRTRIVNVSEEVSLLLEEKPQLLEV